MGKGLAVVRGWLLVGVVALMINLPLLSSLRDDWRLDRSGVEVEAEVTALPASDGAYGVAFRLPDSGTDVWTARIDKSTYDQIDSQPSGARTVPVRVLPDRPAVHEVEGEVADRTGLITTLALDGALVALVVLVRRFRRGLRPVLRLVATDPPVAGDGEPVLDRVGGERYLVRGVVERAEDDEVLLDLGDRRVAVVLDGHPNPAAPGETLAVTGRMVG